ncbi:MAG: VanZ family protein [Bacillaceae bacterium]
MFLGVLLIGIVLGSIISALIYLPIFIIQRKKKAPVIRHLTIYVLIGCFVVIAIATIFLGGITFKPDHYFLNLKPFIWVNETYTMGFDKMIRQLLLNILMFVPLGVLLPMIFKSLRSFWKLALCTLSITILIEVLQYFTGRSADIDDVIMNGLGGIIGYGVFVLLNRVFRNRSWWTKSIAGNTMQG